MAPNVSASGWRTRKLSGRKKKTFFILRLCFPPYVFATLNFPSLLLTLFSIGMTVPSLMAFASTLNRFCIIIVRI